LGPVAVANSANILDGVRIQLSVATNFLIGTILQIPRDKYNLLTLHTPLMHMLRVPSLHFVPSLTLGSSLANEFALLRQYKTQGSSRERNCFLIILISRIVLLDNNGCVLTSSCRFIVPRFIDLLHDATTPQAIFVYLS
jgi:hypothetical protein